MKLTFLERILTLQMLPAESDILTLRIIRDLKSALAATEQEIKDHQIVQDGVQIKWDVDWDSEIAIGEKARDIIVAALNKLNDDKKLTEAHLPLYDKFIK